MIILQLQLQFNTWMIKKLLACFWKLQKIANNRILNLVFIQNNELEIFY